MPLLVEGEFIHPDVVGEGGLLMSIRKEDTLPLWSGLSTMFRLPRSDLEDLREGMVAIAGVSYDYSSTGRWGSRIAPEKIREMSLILGLYEDINVEVADVATGQILQVPTADDVADIGDLNIYPLDWPKTEASLRVSIKEILQRGVLPVILGGDHFVSYPLALGFSDFIAARSQKAAYIQFSCHLDLGTEDPVWGKVWRGATARRILDSGAIDQRNMAWVGIHGYVPADQWALVQGRDLKVFTLQDIRRDGIQEITRRAIESVGTDCSVYVSVDIDVLDGAYAGAADHVTFDGLTPVELQDAAGILRESNVGAWDFMGVNPLMNPTSYPRNCEHLISTIVMRLAMARARVRRGEQSG